MNLIKLHGPRSDHEPNDITIQWSMGNSCNFECEYCPTQLHDGSIGWQSTELYLDVIDKICNHYAEQNKTVNFELIGGEVTVIPGFLEILQKIKEHNGRSIVFTNGSRTRNWWSKAKHYMDGVVLTYHTLSQDQQHLINVINEIKDYVTIDINIAGIGGDVLRLGEFVEVLRDLFKDCEHN